MRYKTLKKQKLKFSEGISPTAFNVLIRLLAPISAVLVATVFKRASLDTYDAARMYSTFALEMEHILMSLLLTVGGTAVLDIALKRHR